MLARTFAAFAFVPVLSLSQAQTPAPAQKSTLSARSTLVLVPALVRNKSGELVYTLSAENFTLTDDGVPQKLILEQDTGGEPLALVVVLEIGGAGAREFNRFASIAPPMAPMLESIIGNVPHKVAAVTFDSQPSLLQDFTSDIDTAASALETLTPGCTRQHHLENCASPLAVHNVPLGDNGAAILDSIGFAVELLRKQPLRVPPGNSIGQRNVGSRKPDQHGRCHSRRQRHQHHHLQHRLLNRKIRGSPLCFSGASDPTRCPLDGEPPPQPSARLYGQRPESRPRRHPQQSDPGL